MPRVLQIVNRFNLGGLIFTSAYLSKYLSPEYETLLIGGPHEPSEESAVYLVESIGVKPLIVDEMRRSINPLQDYLAYRKIRQIIREFKPDIVHTHASKAGALGRMAAFHEKVPFVFHTFHGHVFHSYFGAIVSSFFQLIERYLSTKSTQIIAISELQKKELIDKFKVVPAHKLTLIPYGFNLDKFSEHVSEKRDSFRKKYQLSQDKIVIGTVGRLVPIKNHRLFIDIVCQLQKKHPGKYVGMIVGDGESREEIIAYLKENNSSYSFRTNEYADMILTSWIKEVDEVYAGLDYVLVTSLNEGTPVSLIEAQATGRFVLSTDVGGVRDIIKLDKTGYVASKMEPDEFVQKIESMGMFYPEQRDVAEIVESFSYQKMVEKTRQLYKQAASRSLN